MPVEQNQMQELNPAPVAAEIPIVPVEAPLRAPSTGPRRSRLPGFSAFLLLCMLVGSVSGHQMLACDCTSPQLLGVAKLGNFWSCDKPLPEVTAKAIRYVLTESKDTARTFEGFACRSWKKQIRITSFWTGSTDTVFSEEHVVLTAGDCMNMVRTNKCGEKAMMQEGNAWKFEGVPEADSSYMKIVHGEILNCFYEHLTLEQDSKSGAVVSAAGILAESRQIGFSIRHGTTFVWQKTADTGQHPCTNRVVYVGTGRIRRDNSTDGYLYHLHDDTSQMDFEFSEQVEICGKLLYPVHGDKYAHIEVVNESDSWETRIKPDLPSESLFLAEHFNYYENQIVGHLNRVQQEIKQQDCRNDFEHTYSVLQMSQFSPLLAAQFAGYPDCYALQSFGPTGILTKCEAKNVTFTHEITGNCGYQPVFGNYTIALDGKTLVPKSKCIWRNSFVNFEGIVHEFRNGSWRRVKPSFNAQTSHTRTLFSATVDQSEHFLSFKMAQSTSDMMSLMGELGGLVAESGAESFSEFFRGAVNTTQTAETHSFVSQVKTAFFGVGVLSVGALVGFLLLRFTPVLQWVTPLVLAAARAVCGFFCRPRNRRPLNEVPVHFQVATETVTFPVPSVSSPSREGTASHRTVTEHDVGTETVPAPT